MIFFIFLKDNPTKVKPLKNRDVCRGEISIYFPSSAPLQQMVAKRDITVFLMFLHLWFHEGLSRPFKNQKEIGVFRISSMQVFSFELFYYMHLF